MGKIKEILDETPETPMETPKEQVFVSTSKEDLFLKEIMAEADKTPDIWHAMELSIDEQFQSMFKLPKELEPGKDQAPQAKNYAYVWVEISDERMARMYKQLNFIAVNRTNHPFLPSHYFGSLGAIERSGYSRHVLMYQPRDYNERVKYAISKRYDDRRKEIDNKLEKGGVVAMEVSEKEGGYGTDPSQKPIQVGWKGESIHKESDTYDYAETEQRTTEA
jgi:hypothetical protein